MNVDFLVLIALIIGFIVLFAFKPALASSLLSKLRFKKDKTGDFSVIFNDNVEIPLQNGGEASDKLVDFISKSVLEHYETIDSVRIDVRNESIVLHTKAQDEVKIDVELVESWINSYEKLLKRQENGEIPLEMGDF
jgi:hypothetical protein